MKKTFLTIPVSALLALTSALLTFTFGIATALADYTVVPAPPYDRQFNLETEAGSKQSASILVKNLGNAPITLTLYGVDATQSAQGTFALTTRSAEQRHVGKWITFEKTEITVPPGEEIPVPFIIEVPASATPGSYAGGIAVEDAGKNGPAVAETEASSVKISSRFIVKIFLSVPGEKRHQYEWRDFRYSYSGEDSHARFTFDVSNTGNTIVMVDPKVELDGFPALKQPVIELPTATIQPGTGSQLIELRMLEDPPFGFYWATGSLTFSELDIVKNEKINTVTETRQITINLTPWYFIVIILVVLLALTLTPIIYYFRLRAYRKKCTEYTVSAGDTILSVAEKAGVDWKRVAKLNKLKPPYTLAANTKLIIPPKKKQ